MSNEIDRRKFLKLALVTGLVTACGPGEQNETQKPSGLITPELPTPTSEATPTPDALLLSEEEIIKLLQEKCEVNPGEAVTIIGQDSLAKINPQEVLKQQQKLQSDLIRGVGFTENPNREEDLEALLNPDLLNGLAIEDNPIYVLYTTKSDELGDKAAEALHLAVIDEKKNVACAAGAIPETAGKLVPGWRSGVTKDPNQEIMSGQYTFVNPETGKVETMDLYVGKGGIGTPTPTVENGETSTENKQIAEILGEKEVSVLSIPGKGNLGKIDLITGSNAEGVRGKVLGFEIPDNWDKSIGDPETLNQETIANMLYERWKLQRPDLTMTQDEFTKQLLSGELTDTVITYPVNDGNGGVKQVPVDIKNGVGFGYTDYATFQANRKANNKDTLHVPVTNNSTGFSIYIDKGRLYMLIADRSQNLSPGPINSFNETYRVLEGFSQYSIAMGQSAFDDFSATLNEGEKLLKRWEDITRNVDVVGKSNNILDPLYSNYSDEPGAIIALHVKMAQPHDKDGQ